ncbi:MAG: hypothetical protein AAGF98_07230 [Cyanobacteria bacterium P01_H01_bin.153]
MQPCQWLTVTTVEQLAEMGGPNGRLYADTLPTALVTYFVNHYSLDTPVNLLSQHPIEPAVGRDNRLP